MITTEGIWFKDKYGRVRILRGVNLSGASKVPYTPDGASHLPETLENPHEVSFVGRPFPLEEAEEHFTRLKHWGLDFLRFLVCWEALEHQGPGQYDEDYLEYLFNVIKLAGDMGFRLFIDPHQDMWSRWTGGNWAPAWTLELAGMDLQNLHPTGAAFVHSCHQAELPRMIWASNATKLGCASMFTLFFGSKSFAPQTRFHDQSAEDFLQSHYIRSMEKIAIKVKDLSAVVGFDTLNEPLAGFIGYKHLNRLPLTTMLFQASPTPWQSMLAADGHTVRVRNTNLLGMIPVPWGTRMMNPDKKRLWKEGHECIWKTHGVWSDQDKPCLLKPGYFSELNGRKVNFNQDFFMPFARKISNAIKNVKKSFLIFVESVPGEEFPDIPEEESRGMVNAPHWYDIKTLISKHFSPWFTMDSVRYVPVIGRKNVFRSMCAQLASFKEHGLSKMGNIPTLMGEFGVPFDLDDQKSYKTNDFDTQIEALDLYYNAMDANLLSCTQWNYTPDNNNLYGDLWNGEDLSIFSRDQQKNPEDINSGARGLMGFLRPYARAIAGVPLFMNYNRHSRKFKLMFHSWSENEKGDKSTITEIFLPGILYSQGYEVEYNKGKIDFSESGQILYFQYYQSDYDYEIVVYPKTMKEID